ncbi:MAG: hypothetical protein KY432_09730, partial [Acidobacteria bacterium]|nr:hypothetical protein [Acidobacteriota bacterium]
MCSSLRGSLFSFLFIMLLAVPAAAITPPESVPEELDVRGAFGVPKGTALRAPTPPQLRALESLQSLAGVELQVRYNGLTATPNHLLSHDGSLSGPSTGAPETIARDFVQRWRSIFRFSDADLDSLRLTSRATLPEGTTIVLFEQQVDGVRVYQGDVLVNLNASGQVLSVGGDSFPELRITNTR